MRRSLWLALVGLLLIALGVAVTFMTTRFGPLRAITICAGSGMLGLAAVSRFRDGD